MKKTKCKLKECLLCDEDGNGGICFMTVPISLDELIPNSIKCPFYSTDMQQDLEWVKKQGGMWNISKKRSGKFTDEDIDELKKQRKRKKRKD